MSEILSIGELLDLGGSASTAGLIPYSALEYSAQTITAISGTAIGGQGGTDSATVSAIASAYAESAASGKLDNSASSMFQPSGNYQTAGDYAFNSSVYSKLDASASSQFAPSGNYADASALSAYVPLSASGQFAPSGDYAYNSALSAKLDHSAFTSYTATAQSKIYTGIDPIVVDNENDQISLSATAVHLDSSMTAYTSGASGFIGVNADFNGFVHTADMSGYIPTGESSKYQLSADMSAYIPTSESANYYSTGNPSSFATTAQVAEKLDISSQVVTSTGSSVGPSGTRVITGMNGSAIYAPSATWAVTASAAGLAEQYVVNYSVDSSERYDISSLRFDKLDASAQVVTSTGYGTFSGSSVVNTINGSAISATYAHSALASRDADYASRAGSAIVDAEAYPQVVVPMSAFAYASSVSSKLDASASSDFYSTSNPSGFLTSSYTPTFGYDGDKISSIDGSSLAGGGCAYTSPSGTLAIDNVNGTIDVWNSSMRVDEHVTAASSFPGTERQADQYTNPTIWTGNALPGDVALISAYYQGYYELPNYSASAFGKKVGGGTSKLAEIYCINTGSNPYKASGTTSVTLDAEYSGIYMMVSSQYTLPSTGQYSQCVSGLADVERPAQTASSTSVYENVLKDSMWQSLTAWAVAQGWTP